MRETIKNQNKGVTNVSEEDFDIKNAKIKRSADANWNEFELMESSNRKEGEYINKREINSKKVEAMLKRFQRRNVGIGTLSAINQSV